MHVPRTVLRYGFQPGWVWIARERVLSFAKLQRGGKTVSWVSLSYFVLQLTDCGLLKVDMVQDETLLCAVLEGLDHTDGESRVRLGNGKVGGNIRDSVCGHG